MSKRIIMLITVIVIIVCSVVYIGRQFAAIELEQEPYIVNKEQFVELFNKNRKTFDDLAETAAIVENDIVFQYNSAQSDDQFLSNIKDADAADAVRDIVFNAQMTDIQKYGDYIMVYQYAPIVSSDIQIGAVYNTTSKEWRYYYNHEYNRCRHRHKFIYRLYDLLFNRNGGVIGKA